METADIMQVGRDAVYVMLKISTPLLLIALVVGLIISLIQALTQMQEVTLSFVPKIIAVFIALIFLTGFMITNLSNFTVELFDRIVKIT